MQIEQGCAGVTQTLSSCSSSLCACACECMRTCWRASGGGVCGSRKTHAQTKLTREVLRLRTPTLLSWSICSAGASLPGAHLRKPRRSGKERVEVGEARLRAGHALCSGIVCLCRRRARFACFQGMVGQDRRLPCGEVAMAVGRVRAG